MQGEFSVCVPVQGGGGGGLNINIKAKGGIHKFSNTSRGLGWG